MQKKYFPPEWVSELKSKLNIVQVISSYIPVNRKGNLYWASCPFHHEKTPSFAINEDDQFYHCFGCGEGGDVVKFVREIESISYSEALEKLAKTAGMQLPEFEDGEKIAKAVKEKEEILKALNFAMEKYKENLYQPFAKPAQEYVKQRNFKKSDLEKFGIGYANYSSIIDDAKVKGISPEILVKAGIAGKDSESGKYYDKLSKRLIFPVLNTYGECVGFSGRILEKDPTKAKYKNTEQTPVFDKSSLVYGINLLKNMKRSGELKYIILVEGQIDVISMHSNGFGSAVASLGTAFTEKHSAQLKRICDDIVLLFDGDSAGEKATLRTIGILEKDEFNIKVARLPKGSDPDEFLKEKGKEALQKLLENAKNPIEFNLELFAEKNDVSTHEGKAKFLKQSFELLSKVERMSEKDVYLKLISKMTSVPIDILRRDAQNVNVQAIDINEKSVLISKEDVNTKSVKFVLKSIFNCETFANLDFDIKEYLLNPVHVELLSKFQKSKNKEEFLSELYNEQKKVAFEILNSEGQGEGKEHFHHCLWKIVETTLKVKQQMLMEQYKVVQSYEERKEIAEKLNKIIKQLSERKI